MIIFHVLAYGLLKFVFDDWLTIHFLHLYAILFAIEVAMMLLIGRWFPRRQAWTFKRSDRLDLQAWRFAVPCAVSLASSVVALYLLFSPIGLVNGLTMAFWPLILALVSINMLMWWRAASFRLAITKL